MIKVTLMLGIIAMLCSLAWRAGYQAHADDGVSARVLMIATGADCDAPPPDDIPAEQWPEEEE